MRRLSLALAGLAGAVSAQDHVFPLGFGNASGPPTSSYPLARVKDANFDGTISPNEIWAFGTVLPTAAPSGTNFMTDGRSVVEDGEVAFYFTDSEEGKVVRGVDADHDGVLDPSEVATFFLFGLSGGATPGALFAPDTLGVWRDPVANRTRVYVALDNSTPSQLGFARGIHRLVDTNGDGDAMDAGEQSMFVSGSMGLTVPGVAGPVAIVRDFWRAVRVLPGGKVVAFNQGARLTASGTPPVYTVQPDMNAWLGFTDNNGTAVPEVWLNLSTLNSLPLHPDFASGRFPNWDIQEVGSTPPRRTHYGRFLDVVPVGPTGAPMYFVASSYRTTNEGDLNLNNQAVSGLVYRIVDADNDQTVDPGELSLYCNVSGQVFDGVQPISFLNTQSQLQIATMSSSTWGFAASGDGAAHILFENGGTYDAALTMKDLNTNGVIDQGELTMPYYTPTVAGGYVAPFHPMLGPYFGQFLSLREGLMPGPFPTGLSPIGDGCIAPTRGLKVVMDAWGGAPQLGNLAFAVGSIRGSQFLPTVTLADLGAVPAFGLGGFGLPAQCNGYIANPVTIGFSFGDAEGRAIQPLPIPANPQFLGVSIVLQAAVYDVASPAAVPFYTTNALQLTVQP